MSHPSPRPRRPLAESPAAIGPETELNMTPMIDVVFQLIVFFLLSLKFKTLDERIDAQLPSTVGPFDSPVPPEETPKVKLKLIRRHKGLPDAHTVVKVDNSHELRLPGEPGDRGPDAAHRAVKAQLVEIVRAKWAAVGHDPRMRAEIATPPPHGGAVPHGDAIFALDTLVEAGLTDIRFEGTRAP